MKTKRVERFLSNRAAFDGFYVGRSYSFLHKDFSFINYVSVVQGSYKQRPCTSMDSGNAVQRWLTPNCKAIQGSDIMQECLDGSNVQM